MAKSNKYEIQIGSQMENKFTTKDLIDFYYKLMHDITDRYFKGYAFYLAINAAVFGFTFSSSLQEQYKSKVLIVGLIINILFYLVTFVYTIWTFKIYKTLRLFLSKVTNENDFEKTIQKDTKSGHSLLQVLALGANCSVLTIIIAYLSLL